MAPGVVRKRMAPRRGGAPQQFLIDYLGKRRATHRAALASFMVPWAVLRDVTALLTGHPSSPTQRASNLGSFCRRPRLDSRTERERAGYTHRSKSDYSRDEESPTPWHRRSRGSVIGSSARILRLFRYRFFGAYEYGTCRRSQLCLSGLLTSCYA